MNSQIKAIIAVAKSYVGTKESPPNSNNVIFNTVYYGRAVSGPSYPWCMVFVWYVFCEAGISILLYDGRVIASCTTLMNWAKERRQFHTSDFRPGDIVLFNWDGGRNVAQHVGIITEVTDDYVITIEGNTAVGNDSNGGEVMERKRKYSQIIGVYRPAYAEDAIESEVENDMVRYEKLSDIPDDWGGGDPRATIEKLMDAKIINGDGSDKDGNNDVIDLSHDMMRMLLFNYRGGAYDKKLIAAGIPAAVQ